MSSIKEIKEAYKILKRTKKEVIPLYCISSYPSNLNEFDLKKMLNIKKINKHFGFSDHTIGNEASLFAIANGARIIEKHLTLSKKFNGPDHYASMEPKNFKILVCGRYRPICVFFVSQKKYPGITSVSHFVW